MTFAMYSNFVNMLQFFHARAGDGYERPGKSVILQAHVLQFRWKYGKIFLILFQKFVFKIKIANVLCRIFRETTVILS